MADVFISYAHEDRSVVRELVHSLTRAGFSVWWDRELAVGAELALTIERELAQARCVIVVWSIASVRSNWVIGESNAALDAGNLVPIVVDDARIPLPFRVCETANMQGWPTENRDLQLQKLLLSVRTHITGEPIDEAEAHAANDQHDPTVSIRIANRVAEVLAHSKSSGDVEVLELRLDIETALANFGLALLNGEANRSLINNFLGSLETLLRTSYVNIWNASAQIYGWDSRGRELANRLDHHLPLFLNGELPANDDEDFLKSNGLKWAYIQASENVYLSIGSTYSTRPPAQVLSRLEIVCELIARHETLSVQNGR